MQRHPNIENNNMSTEELVHLARKAIEYTSNTLTIGSTNRYADQLRPSTFAIATQRLQGARERAALILLDMIEGKERLLIENDNHLFLLSIYAQAIVFTEERIGNCTEHAVIALTYLADKNLQRIDSCRLKDGGDHSFLILNGTVVCDPWANQTFHIDDFDKKLTETADFRYADSEYLDKANPPPIYHGTLEVENTLMASSDMFSEIVAKSEQVIAREKAEANITFDEFCHDYTSAYTAAGFFGRNPLSKMKLLLQFSKINNIRGVRAYIAEETNVTTRAKAVYDNLIQRKMAI